MLERFVQRLCCVYAKMYNVELYGKRFINMQRLNFLGFQNRRH